MSVKTDKVTLPAWVPCDLEPIQDRALTLGGTDVAAIMGLCNPQWGNPYQVWLEKTGKGVPFAGNYQTRRGTALEPVVCAEYERMTKHKVIRPAQAYRRADRPWQGGSPDGLLPETPCVVEFKTKVGRVAAEEWGADGSDVIPLDYRAQLLWYLLLTDASYGELVADLNEDVRIYQIGRDDEVESRLLEEAEAFWTQHILADVPPEVTVCEAAEAYIRAQFPRHTAPLRLATAEEEDWMLRLANLTHQMKAAEAEEENLKLKLKAALGEAEGLEVAGLGRITYRAAKDSPKTDWQAIALQLRPQPELVAQFTEIKPGSRRFLKHFVK